MILKVVIEGPDQTGRMYRLIRGHTAGLSDKDLFLMT